MTTVHYEFLLQTLLWQEGRDYQHINEGIIPYTDEESVAAIELTLDYRNWRTANCAATKLR